MNWVKTISWVILASLVVATAVYFCNISVAVAGPLGMMVGMATMSCCIAKYDLV